MTLARFAEGLTGSGAVTAFRDGLIGEGATISGPFGDRPLVYADYTASGRALRQVENFVTESVLPFYANSHTESSFCGAYTTRLREQARQIIAAKTNAEDDCSVIFTGSGATAAVNRLVALCGAAEGTATGSPARRLARLFGGPARSDDRTAVFIGPYEHHSNILPWRESGAEVVEIPEDPGGGPDLTVLEAELAARRHRPLLIGAFSAASNVTGIVTDADAVTAVLKRHGALAFWDYAGGGPYLPIDMAPGAGLEKDAVFLSPHKFPGGPGASGVLIVRHTAVRATRPTWPGGGSVSYVSPWAHDYFESLIEREEAGTPNVIGDIRAALAFLVKDAIGTEFIAARDAELGARALNRWTGNPNLDLLGVDKPRRLPIFSFRVRDGNGGHHHHQLVTRMLSDLHGVQARGGCVCAGPYGHRLLGVAREPSERIRRAIRRGEEIEKPGWVRLNLGYLMDDATADHIIESVDDLARTADRTARHYSCDRHRALFQFEAA